MTDTVTPALQADNLVKIYDEGPARIEVLSNVSLSVARGEMVAGADRKQALRVGVPPLRLTALASKSAETFGSAQETADDGPDQHRGEDNHQQRQHQHRQRGVDAPHAP